jgi:hypothetical protein
MSLFGDDQYQWRETYFVLFRDADRPSAESVVTELADDDDRTEVVNVRSDESGRLESLTLKAPDDFSAMDLTFVKGDEVKEQVDLLLRDLARTTLDETERGKLDQLGECDARFDVFHFEQIQMYDDAAEEILDPGGLLIVLEKLARLCQGVGVDPQSGSLMP